MHDAWAPYDTYTEATHALCNSHVLRELAAVTDADPTAAWCWARQAADALCVMKNLIDTALADTPGDLADVDHAALGAALVLYRSAVRIGEAATKNRATKVEAKHHALARRLINREPDYLRFTTNPEVEGFHETV